MNGKLRPRLLFICLLLLGICACTQPPRQVTPATPTPAAVEQTPTEPKRLTQFPGRGQIGLVDAPQAPKIQVELARTDEERQQGLMYRQNLADDAGMLFFMPNDSDWAFYMRNTYVRLDMIFIDTDWRVVGVVANVPPLTEDHRQAGAPSRYVLELAAHQASKRGIATGTRLAFGALPDAPSTPVPAPSGAR